MGEINDERINKLRSSIHELRVFLNYSNSMKRRNDIKTEEKVENKEFNKDKILKIDLKNKSNRNDSSSKSSKLKKEKNNKKVKHEKLNKNNNSSNKTDDKVTVLPGECVVNQGEQGKSAFLIISGSFNVEIDKKVVGSMSTGDIFGELSLILGEKRKATVRAISGSEVVEINPSFLKEYLLSSNTNTEKVNNSRLETQKVIKELSVELGKKKNQKLSMKIDKLSEIIKDETNIIKSLAIQLHKRLSKMISDAEKKQKILEMNN